MAAPPTKNAVSRLVAIDLSRQQIARNRDRVGTGCTGNRAVAQHRDAQRIVSSTSSNRAASNRQGCHHGVGTTSSTIVLLVRPLFSDSESSPSAKETLFALAAALNTIVSFAVSAVPPSEAPAIDAPLYQIVEGQQVCTAATNQRGIRNRSGDRETVIALTAMQIGAGNTSSDIDRVVSAICLDIGIRQRVAQLDAVLSLAPVNARIDDRSDKRIVSLSWLPNS